MVAQCLMLIGFGEEQRLPVETRCHASELPAGLAEPMLNCPSGGVMGFFFCEQVFAGLQFRWGAKHLPRMQAQCLQAAAR